MNRWIFLHRTSLFWTFDKIIQGTVDGLHLPACLDGFHRLLNFSAVMKLLNLGSTALTWHVRICSTIRVMGSQRLQTLCFSAFSLRLDACLFCLCFKSHSPLVLVLTDRGSSRGSHLEVNCDYEDLSFTAI